MPEKYIPSYYDISRKDLNAVKRIGLGSFGDERDVSGLRDAADAKRGIHRAYFLPREFLGADISYYGVEEEKTVEKSDFPDHESKQMTEIFSKIAEYSSAEEKEAELRGLIDQYNKASIKKHKRDGGKGSAYKLSFDNDSKELTAKGIGEDVKGTSVVRKSDDTFLKKQFNRKSKAKLEAKPSIGEVDKDNPGKIYTAGGKSYIVEKDADGEDVYYELKDYPQASKTHAREWQEMGTQSISRGNETKLYSHEIVLSGSEIDSNPALGDFAKEMRALQDRYGRKIFKSADIDFDNTAEVPTGTKAKKVTLVFDSSRKDFSEAAIELYDFMQMSNRTYEASERTGARLDRKYRDAYKRMDGLPFVGPLSLVPAAIGAVAEVASNALYYVPVLSAVSPVFARVSDACYEGAARGAELTPFPNIGVATFLKGRQVALKHNASKHYAFEKEHDGNWFTSNGYFSRLPRNLVAATTGAFSTLTSAVTAAAAIPINAVGDGLARLSIYAANAGKNLARKSDSSSKLLLSPLAYTGSAVSGLLSLPFKAVGSVVTTLHKAVSVGEYLADPNIPAGKRTWGAPFGSVVRAITKTVDSVRVHEIKPPKSSESFIVFDVDEKRDDKSAEVDELTKLARQCALDMKPLKTKKSRIPGDNKNYIKLGEVKWENKRIKIMLDQEGNVKYSNETWGAGYSSSTSLTDKIDNTRGFYEEATRVMAKNISTSQALKSPEYSLAEFRKTFLTPDKGAESETTKDVALKQIKEALDKAARDGGPMVRSVPGTNRYTVGNNWFSGNYIIEVTEAGIGIAKQRNEVDTEGSLPLVDFTTSEDGSVPINSDLFKAMNWIAAKTGETHKRKGEVANWHEYVTEVSEDTVVDLELSDSVSAARSTDDAAGVGSHPTALTPSRSAAGVARPSTVPPSTVPPSFYRPRRTQSSAAAPSPSPSPASSSRVMSGLEFGVGNPFGRS